MKLVVVKIIFGVLLVPNKRVFRISVNYVISYHAGYTENDTAKISPCFANHNIIEKNSYQLMIFNMDFNFGFNFSEFEGI